MELEQIRLSLNSRILIDGANLRIDGGKITSLMGASGSGKSTLLSYISGTYSNNITASGRIILKGQNVHTLPTEKRKIGLLFQDALLFPHLNVGENLAFGLAPSVDKTQRRRRVLEALERAHLPDICDKNPAVLSGGERSRVALMRTLLAEPDALLLDEPFSRLDEELKQSFREFVFETTMEKNIPVLMVTHDPQDAKMAHKTTGGPIFTLLNQQIRISGNDNVAKPKTQGNS